jgi:hypothetical protein
MSLITLQELSQKPALLELHYLPSIAYFCAMIGAPEIIIEAHEHYEKQSFRNRCYVRGANGIEALTVPVKKGGRKQAIKALEIDNSVRWRHQHWHAIRSAYGKAPYFEYFAEDLQRIYEKEHNFLFNLNQELLTLCLKLAQATAKLEYTQEFIKNPSLEVNDLRYQIHPKKDFENLGFFSAFAYKQVFGNEFVANLCILDLLFCEGPNTLYILRQSLKNSH